MLGFALVLAGLGGCDSGCEDSEEFAIDASDTELQVTCKDIKE